MTRYGIDIDGVLADFDEACGRAMTLAPNELSAEVLAAVRRPASYWYEKRDLVGPENWEWFWSRAVTYYTVFASSRPIGRELFYLDQLPGEKFLITSRPKLCRPQTFEWLSTYQVAVEGVLHVNSPEEKVEWVNALKLDYFVDDHPRTVMDMIPHAPGTQCYVFDQPWNRDVEAPRIRSLEELL